MKSLLLIPPVLALVAFWIQDSPPNPEKDEAHGDHSYTVPFKQVADGEMIVKELYPKLRTEGLMEQRAVRIKGKHDDVERVGNLLVKLSLLEASQTWALITVPNGIRSDRFANMLKAETGIPTHAGATQVLIYGPQESIERASTTALDMAGRISKTVDNRRLDDSSAATRADIEESVRAEFEARQKVHRAELQLLKSKLAEFEARLKTYEESKELMIQKRIDELMNAPSLDAMQPAEAAAAKSKPSGAYKVQAGDTLGIFIPNVLGQEGEKPPIHKDPSGRRGPVMGYPISVRDDGTISLPLIEAQKVAGLSIRGVEGKLVHEYTVANEILRKDRDVIMVSLIRSVDDPVAQPAPEAVPTTRRGNMELPLPMTASDVLRRYVQLRKEFEASRPGTPAEDDALAGLAMLREEHEAAQATLVSRLRAQQALLQAATDTLEQAEARFKNGLMDGSSLPRVRADVPAAEAKLIQVEALLGSLKKVKLNDFRRPQNSSRAIDTTDGTSSENLSNLGFRILKSPSEFADKFVELESLAKNGKGGSARRGAITRLKALQAEYDLQLSMIRTALASATSKLWAASNDYKRTKLLYQQSLVPENAMQREQAKRAEAETRVTQFESIWDAYRAIRPKKAEKPKERAEADVKPTKHLQLEDLARIEPVRTDAKLDIVTLEKATLRLGKNKQSWIIADDADQILRRFIDSDNDGTVDRHEFFRAGKITYVEVDTNDDRKIDRFEYFEDGKRARVLVDTDGDGEVDEQSGAGQ